jgi:hypothetical protein
MDGDIVEFVWKGKLATLTPEFFNDTNIDSSAPFEWKGKTYRPVERKENGDIVCRVLEEK